MTLPGLLLVLALLLGSAPAARAESDLPAPARWPIDGSHAVIESFNPPREEWGAGHRGIDLAAAAGEPVHAAAAGRVTFAADLAGRGVVVVDHGSVRTTYEPVRATVRVGDRVPVGAEIGTIGSGGHCDGRCLHLGLKRGTDYLDPLRLFDTSAGATGSAEVRLLPLSARTEAADRAAGRMLATGAGVRGDHSPGAHGLTAPVNGPITSPFGMRRHPVTGVVKLHDGVDFGAPCGTPLVAPADGRVRQAYFNPGYGNRVILDHGSIEGQRVQTAVNHLSATAVRPGQRVHRGDVLGRVGSTGYSTGCHLHLMLWLDGRLVDPLVWF